MYLYINIYCQKEEFFLSPTCIHVYIIIEFHIIVCVSLFLLYSFYIVWNFILINSHFVVTWIHGIIPLWYKIIILWSDQWSLIEGDITNSDRQQSRISIKGVRECESKNVKGVLLARYFQKWIEINGVRI